MANANMDLGGFDCLSAACDWLRANGYTYCQPMSCWFNDAAGRRGTTYKSAVTRTYRIRFGAA